MTRRDTANKFIFKKAAIAMLMSVAILGTSLPNIVAKADKISELEEKIKAVKEQKNQTESQIKANKKELESLNSTTNSLKGALSQLNSELDAVSENLADLEDRIVKKNQEIEEMTEDLNEAIQIENDQYKAMKIRIKYMYEKQDFAIIESLFSASSFSDFLNRNEYFESLAAYDRKMLTQFQETRRVVEEAKAMLEDEKVELDNLRQEALEEQGRVSGLVSRTTNSISGYESEIAQTEEEMKAQEEQLAMQQASISALQKELAEERRLSELAKRSAWRDISQVTFAPDDRYLLANLIYCEAGNQPFEGQVAVGAVVMNRVMSSVFPDTVVGVIYQRKQFSPVGSGRLALALARNDATAACYQAADAAMSGQTTVGNCLFFRTPIEGLTGIQIGGHIFY
ncbi:MAG: cell wall hydrolase [Lachnospiraceae bacterium]|nr:cell wall hydrolase [Lachnospiraceae bacterium]